MTTTTTGKERYQGKIDRLAPILERWLAAAASGDRAAAEKARQEAMNMIHFDPRTHRYRGRDAEGRFTSPDQEALLYGSDH